MIYADPRYLAALGGAAPYRVAAWAGAAVACRPIPGSPRQDVAGPYPLMPFDGDWDIAAGLRELRAAGAVSAVFVADPVLAPADIAPFQLARPYKRHHLVERSYAPSAHHAAEIRRAARRCEVARVGLAEALPDWRRLYAGLVARRAVAGQAAGLDAGALAPLNPVVLTARVGGRIAAMSLWLRHGRMAWYHLAASDAAGRAASAGYALVDAAIRALMADGVDLILLGGGLAEAADPPCGLERFKAGFGNAVRVNTLLGAVLDAPAYAALGGDAAGGYFPAYRAPRREAA